MKRASVIAGAALASAAGWAIADYRAWRALGVGGLPPTWGGWLTTTRLRLMQRDPLRLTEDEDAATRLADLPPRAGRRPRVGPHPVPHRQLTQHAPAAAREALTAMFDTAVADAPDRLMFATSHFERNNAAVTLHPAFCTCAAARATHGEIAHIHPSDASMHMILAAADADRVIASGWGQRHGLAGIALGLPPTYMLIYAPRDSADVAVVARILDAAIAHIDDARAGD